MRVGSPDQVTAKTHQLEKMKKLIVVAALAAMSGCGKPDPNSRAIFGESGLPSNCRAYVQFAVDSYRAKQYSADQVFVGLERNCGINGISWTPSQ